MVRVLPVRAVRGIALACLAAIAATIVVTSAPSIAGADTYPGLSDIAAAKAAVANAQTGVAELDAAIVSLENAAQEAQTEALVAADRYTEAKATAERTQRESEAATQSAKDAAAQLEQARNDLAGVALQVYRDGGKMTSLEAIIGANGFEDVIARTEDNDRAATQMDAVTQKVKAAELYASTMSDFAEQAATSAATAADDAAKALAAAEDSQRSAQQAVADAEATRGAALERLASLQNTTVALETQRQQGLADERAQRERTAYQAAVAAAQAKADASAAAAAQAQSSATATANANAAANATANANAAAAAAAAAAATSGGSGGTTSGTTTGGTTAGTPVASEPSGSSSSSADQGQRAAAYAKTLLGSPYAYGGNGPAYDCSGLTSASWGSVGISIPRSSRTQYAGVAHVPFSQLRPGDLIFWGTNRDASQIYHVAIYIGGGLVAEATVPGSTAKTRDFDASWNLGDIMPYAGRP